MQQKCVQMRMQAVQSGERSVVRFGGNGSVHRFGRAVGCCGIGRRRTALYVPTWSRWSIMVQMRSASVVNFALFTTLATALAPWLAANAFPSFPAPGQVAAGTNVRVTGSSNLAPLNQSVKKGFEQQYAGAKATVSNLGTTAALDAVAAGQSDIAAIGRPLSDAEKAKGLVAVPVGRDKIAIVVGAKNAYKKDLTINQFAKLFRGEAKTWKDVGGANTPVRFVDRVTTDTRAAFPNYPAFKGKPLATGATAVKVDDENPTAMSAKLGNDGISFLPASLVAGQKDIRVLTMHGVQPTDKRYPFSQELFYVYKGDKPNPAVQAFLGYAGAAAGQGAIGQAVKNPIDFNQQAEAGKVAQMPANAVDPAKVKAAADAKAKLKAETQLGDPQGDIARAKAAADAKAKADGKTPVNSANAPKAPIAEAETKVVPAKPGAVANNQIAIGDEAGRGMPQWLWWLLLPLGLLGLLLWLLPKDEEEDVLPRGGTTRGGTSNFEGGVPNPLRGVGKVAGGAVDGVTGTAGKVAGAVGDTANAGGAVVAGAGAAVAGAGAAAMARLRGNKGQDDVARRSNDSEWEPGTGANPSEFGIETPDWNLNPNESSEVIADDQSWLQTAQDKVGDAAGGTKDALGNAFDSGGAAVAGAGAAAAGVGAAAWSRLRGNGDTPPDEPTTTDTAADWEFEGGLPPANADPSSRMADFASDTSQAGGNLFDRAKGAAGDAKDAVSGGVSNVAGSVSGGVGTGRDRLQSAAGNLTETAGDATATTSGWLKSLFGKAKDVAGDATDAAAGVGGQLKDGVTGAAGATVAGLGAAGAAVGSAVGIGSGRVVMVPYNSREALVRWEMGANAQEKLRQQGGTQLVLRLYDVTDMDVTDTLLSTFEQFDVDEATQEQRILIPQRDRAYLTVLGYLTRSGGFLEVSRSESVQIPAI
jgi:phosphate transport system substrate-binding protein